MHKKLEADLISLAHSILQMKNKDNVFLLKQKSKEIYEKLAVLAFVEEYVNSTVYIKETKEELLSKVEKAFEKKDAVVEETVKEAPITYQLEDDYLEFDNQKLEAEIGDGFDKEDEKVVDKVENLQESLNFKKEEAIEQPFDELEEILASEPENVKEQIKEEPPLTLADVKKIQEENNASPTDFKDDPKDVGGYGLPTLEEELQDTIPVDIMANLFEPAKPKSLNDKLQSNIQIGLNDRIAFVKNLFEGSQEDFNRVISQLNTIKTEKEAKNFINKMVKPDYNWEKQEALEARFMEIIERKFA
ncbi:hypothetical protein JL193_07040 [Polaribacter batillariae]|uniref:Uncharacterized protein n=1 Tax=Polaribacter batillariae TaxID=2808900 RepID=A0ABX7T0E4_9FLAO|nr:hypothetical protein [Polaribacter batillariae]QTD39000.1 hypothetical protein JL193_07040 [Polaribacter batillariae]